MLMRPFLSDLSRPLPLQQSSVFVTALRALGRDAQTVPLEDAGQAVVITRRSGPLPPVRFTSRGPIWHADASIDERAEALRRARIPLINAPPGDAPILRQAGFRQIITPASVATLAVHADRDWQMAQARVKWRNAARQMARKGLNIQQPGMNDGLLGWLLAADALQQRQKSYRALPGLLTRAIARADIGCTHVWTANRGNTPHAAMLFVRHGAAATYHIGWSDPVGRNACAHHALLLHAAEQLAKRGVSVIDLGTVDTHNAPGLARFKIGSGAEVSALGGTWLRMRSWRR